MTRRAALAVASLVAALVAGWAATSGASTPPVVKNRGAESVVIGIALPLGLFLLIVAVGSLFWFLLKRRLPDGDDVVEVPNRRRGHLVALLAPVVTIALIVLVFYFSRSHSHPHLAAGLATSHGARSSASVQVSKPAFDVTSLLLLALLALFLVRHRFGLLRGRLPLSATRASPAAVTETTVAAVGSEHTDVDIGDPSEEPDPRRAIVLAYRRFGMLMARRGLRRADHETVFEYCDRVAAAPVEQIRRPTSALTALFSAARYGNDPPSREDRIAAIAQLNVISKELETA